MLRGGGGWKMLRDGMLGDAAGGWGMLRGGMLWGEMLRGGMLRGAVVGWRMLWGGMLWGTTRPMSCWGISALSVAPTPLCPPTTTLCGHCIPCSSAGMCHPGLVPLTPRGIVCPCPSLSSADA